VPKEHWRTSLLVHIVYLAFITTQIDLRKAYVAPFCLFFSDVPSDAASSRAASIAAWTSTTAVPTARPISANTEDKFLPNYTHHIFFSTLAFIYTVIILIQKISCICMSLILILKIFFCISCILYIYLSLNCVMTEFWITLTKFSQE
jgi:hypothetical protein